MKITPNTPRSKYVIFPPGYAFAAARCNRLHEFGGILTHDAIGSNIL
jgi:hypothetical protein